MSYLTERYKGTYRLLVDYDKSTNQFPRKLDNTYEDIDVYITCLKGIRIFYRGHGVLTCYIPSLQTGHNIIKQLYATYINPDNVIIENKITTVGDKEVNKTTYIIKNQEQYISDLNKKDFIFNIEETDEEVLFDFKANDDEKIFPLLKPKTSGADRSPFSSKNLPKSKYDIPEEDLNMYKALTINFSIENGDWLRITRLTKDFINSLANKKNKIQDIKSDMAKKGLKGKEYIHSINKWNEYIKYLKHNLE